MKKIIAVSLMALAINIGCSSAGHVIIPDVSAAESFLGTYLVPVALAQVEEPVVVNVNFVTVTWNAPTLNEDGTPCDDLATYELAVSNPDQDPNAGGTLISKVSLPSTQTTYEMKNFDMTGVPTDFKLWARALDGAGNASTWSEPLFLRHDGVAPNTVIITITVTAPQ